VVTGEVAPEDLLEDQLIENLLRDDLKPIEQARAFRSILASRGLSQRQLAERLQIGQATIAKALSLLNLPESIQASVDAGAIGPDIAYELTKVADPAEQADLAGDAAKGRIKRDEIKERTRSQRSETTKGRGEGKGKTSAKGKVRLPAELKHRSPNGCRVVVQTMGKHALADVVGALQEFADRLRAEMAPEMKSESQEAA
jgi:ParB family chromosome partitioning protein